MQEKKKVVICSTSLCIGKGGAEKNAIALANYLVKKGYCVGLSYNYVKGASLSYEACDEIVKIPYEKNEESRRKCIEQFQSFNPDVIIIFYVNKASIKRFYDIAAVINCPIVTHEGTNTLRCYSQWKPDCKQLEVARWERQVYYSGVSQIRLILKDYLSFLTSSEKEKAIAFPNAFKPAIKKANVALNIEGRKRIINIGGLKSNKNLIPLLKAFGALASDFPNWDLYVFGAPAKHRLGQEYLCQVKKNIAELGLRNRCILAGPVDDIYSEYSKSHIHVITSLSEGLPNCVIESMIHGIPSIGFQCCPGTNSLIKNNINGMLVKDERELKISLEKLMSQNSLREKLSEGCSRGIEVFDEEYVYSNWIKAIENAIAKGFSPLSFPTDCNEIELSLHNKRMLRSELKAS